jgi:VanZ family protein
LNNASYVLVCVGVAVLVALFPTFFLPLDWLDSASPEVFDSAHILYFLLFGAVLLRLWTRLRQRTFAEQIIIIALLSAALGGAIELGQLWTHRASTVSDVCFDIVGGSAAVAFLSPARQSLHRGWLLGLQTLSVVVMIAALWPAITFGIDVWQAQRRFPMLVDFETPFSHYRVSRGRVETAPAPNGSRALRVDLTMRKYSGVQIQPVVTDWQKFAALLMRVYVDGEGVLPLTISIVDRHHYARGGDYYDRFNRVFRLKPGWNDVRIALSDVEQAPRNRRMDMSGIIAVNLFVAKPQSPRRIYLDDVQLE